VDAEADLDKSYPSPMLSSDADMGRGVRLSIVGGEAKRAVGESGEDLPKDVTDVGTRAEFDGGEVGSVGTVLPSPLEPPRGM